MRILDSNGLPVRFILLEESALKEPVMSKEQKQKKEVKKKPLKTDKEKKAAKAEKKRERNK